MIVGMSGLRTPPTPRAPRVLALALLAAGCASAGKRLEQGIEAESSGSYYQAAMRYVEALEKDAELAEARDRLLVAGDSAVVIGLSEAEALAAEGDPVGAAEEFLALERLFGRARSVGVRIPAPEGYAELRRGAYDGAIDALMEDADHAREREEWGRGRSALARVRRDFVPSPEQRLASEEAEARLLLAWAEAEERAARPRRAWDLAGEALDAVRPLPAEVADRAETLRERALADGTRTVAVLPVEATAPVRDRMEGDLDRQLSDLLELGYWREPPLFVVVADPVLVRQVARRIAPPGVPLRPGRILDEVGADFGVLVELTDLVTTERDVRRELHEARTRDGRLTSWTEERSTLTLTLEARVLVLDPAGRELGEARARASESGRVERGIYRGDPSELDLSRGERRLFDPVVLRQQHAAIEDVLMEDVAQRVADRVFSTVLARIP
ncbi:MAG TPA: hypothetical protein VK849_01895 [Longimicrobiales bacterium]|nr:hypothetical protein [Longimicrobiales bacterium]